MKPIYFTFTLCILFCTTLLSQTNYVHSYGDSTFKYIGQQGIIDKSNNKIMGGKRFTTQDNPHVAMFDQNNVYKWSFYLNNPYATCTKVLQVKDGNYISIYASGIGAQVIKFDAQGGIIWFKNFSGINNINDAVEDTATANVFFVGSASGKLVLMSFDAAGNTVLSTAFKMNPVTDYLTANSIVITASGHLLISAVAADLGVLNSPAVLLKVSKTGSLVWAKVNSEAASSIVIESVIESSVDKSLFGVGYRSTTTLNTFDAFSIKLDSLGNHINSKAFNYNFEDRYYDVCQSDDGGFVAIGYSKPVANCGGNLLLTKFNGNNTVSFHKNYGTASGNGAFFNNIVQNGAGAYHAFGCGSLWAVLANPYIYTSIKMDNQLNLPCMNYNQIFTETSLNITQASNVVSSTYTPTFTTAYVKTFDTSFTAVDACTSMILSNKDINENKPALDVFPVPANDKIIIKTSSANERYTLQILSADGKIIQALKPHKGNVTINTSNWINGIYFIQLTNAQQQRIVKQISVVH